MFDIEAIETLLHGAAVRRRAMSYSELLLALGMRFTRPRMRALVVRESDGLPGQGWWTMRSDYVGAWEGAAAGAYLRSVQRIAFDYWAKRAA